MTMRKKAAVGGGVLAAAVLAGVMLSEYFNLDGFGLGGGGDGGQALLPFDSGDGKKDDRAPEDDAQPVSTDTGDDPTARSGPPLQPGEVLNVVIDGREYAVRQVIDGNERVYPMSLPEIADLAKAAPGNNEGIKVRVFRRESSRPTAEQALEQALLDAGLDQSEILQTEELLAE